MKRYLLLVLLALLPLLACAQGRAEERAISHALDLGFVAPVADCDGEREGLPGHLLCNVEEQGEGLDARGIRLACPKGLADSDPCFVPAPNGTFGLSGGAF